MLRNKVQFIQRRKWMRHHKRKKEERVRNPVKAPSKICLFEDGGACRCSRHSCLLLNVDCALSVGPNLPCAKQIRTL